MHFPPSMPKSDAAQALFESNDSFPEKSGWGRHVTAQLEVAIQMTPPSQLARAATDVIRGDVEQHARVVAHAWAADFRLAAPLHLNERPDAFPPGDIPRGAGPPFRVWEISGGYFVPTGGMPLIYNASHELLAELSSAYWPLRYFYQSDAKQAFENALSLTGDTLVLADDIWDVNFCHWLVDTLPRLALLGPQRRSAAFNVIVGPISASFQKESLAALGITSDRVYTAGDGVAFRCERMLVPTDLGHIQHPAHKASSWATDFLKSAFRGRAATPQPQRVYLSRSDASRRTIINEAELVPQLEKRGFQTVRLSELSFLEQAALLRDAHVVIGLHGAGMSNVVFMPSGGSVIEVFPHSYGTMSFWPLAVAGGNTYYTYNERSLVAGERPQCDDIVLDVNDFVARLDTLLR